MGNSAHWNRQGGQAKCRGTSKKSLFVVDRAVPACRWVKETSLNDFFFFHCPPCSFPTASPISQFMKVLCRKVNPSGSHLMAVHWQVVLVVFAFFFFFPSRLTGILGDELELGEFWQRQRRFRG